MSCCFQPYCDDRGLLTRDPVDCQLGWRDCSGLLSVPDRPSLCEELYQRPAHRDRSLGWWYFPDRVDHHLFITSRIADFIIDSRIGALDRTLGFLFGAARGILLLVVAVAFWNWLIDAKQRPDWVNNAKSKPFLDALVVKLEAVLPAISSRNCALASLASSRLGRGRLPRKTRRKPHLVNRLRHHRTDGCRHSYRDLMDVDGWHAYIEANPSERFRQDRIAQVDPASSGIG